MEERKGKEKGKEEEGEEKTFMNQRKLLRLPINHLSAALNIYLRACRAVLNDAEYEKAKSIIEDFGKKGGQGEILHGRLVEHEKALQNETGFLKGSWIEKWWLEQAYLAWREPLMIFSNWFLAFEDLPFTQVQRAARLIYYSVEFKELLEKEKLAPEKIKGTPICMDQFKLLFSTCRIPGETVDQSKAVVMSPHKFVTVLHKDQIYEMDVYHPNGSPCSISDLENQLQWILNDPNQDLQPPIGWFTSQHRDAWGKAYKMLKRYPVNESNFNTIECSLFNVCLDETSPSTLDALASHCLHAEGKNRWFEKAISILVCKNGRAGMSGEHSPLDGTVAGTYADYILGREKEDSKRKISHNQPSYPPWQFKPSKLIWKVDKEILVELEKARIHAEDLAKKIDVCILDFKLFGLKEIRSTIKQSPDALFQMAMQLAFFRIHGTFPPTYESASTRRYLHGRTECIRALSVDSINFVKAMASEDKSPKEKYALLSKACESHMQYLNEASAGRGADRLFLGLRNMLQPGEETPQLFKDSIFSKVSHYQLSTSNMAPALHFFPGYGPGVEDGYGCCYVPGPNGIKAGISSWKTCKETDSQRFREELTKALLDIKDLAEKSQRDSKL